MTFEEKQEAWAKAKCNIDFESFGLLLPMAWFTKKEFNFFSGENTNWFNEMDRIYGEEEE
jgi:hypothetical protein